MFRYCIAVACVAALTVACTPPAADETTEPGTQPPVEMDEVGASGQPAATLDPMYCMNIADMQVAAINEGRIQGDAAAAEAMGDAFETKVRTRYDGDAFSQYRASTMAVFDDLSDETLTAEAARCAAAVDEPFDDDSW